MDLAKGELVGQIGGEDTVATKALEQERLDSLRRDRLLREEMYGGKMGPGNIKEETQAAKEASQRHALMEGELLGEYGGDRTLQKEALEAELTGRYGEEDTFAARTQKKEEDYRSMSQALAARELQRVEGASDVEKLNDPIMRGIINSIQDPQMRRSLMGSDLWQTRPKAAMVEYAKRLKKKGEENPTGLRQEEQDFLWMYENNAGLFGSEYEE